MEILKKIIGKSIQGITLISLLIAMAIPAHAQIVFQNEFLIENLDDNNWIIDSGDDVTTGNIGLQFGNTVAETIIWDTGNSWFEFSNNVSLGENQLVEAEVENVTGDDSLPGGATGLGTQGRGRLVILTGTDDVAPGCTVDPYCTSGTYIWDGSSWISLVGSATSTNLTKVVTVGSSGADYTTIDNAATYLSTRSGGIMLLAAETHQVTTAVDLKNVRLVGKDATRTTIEVSGAGQLDTFDTIFEYLTIETTGTLTDDMAIDVQSGASSLIFNYADFEIATGTDVLIDSNAGTAPTIISKFIKSNVTSGNNGSMLKPQASANINTASDIFIDSRSSDNPLELEDWDVTLAGGGSVNTTGTIISVPAQTIYVSPEMNLQGAIDSLETVGNGGLITLLPGTHTITSTITIEDDGIQIVGYGDSSIISASGITGSETAAVIQIGATNGSTTVDDVVLSDFKMEYSGTGVHGIRVCGGEDNRIDNVTVEKTSGTDGSGDSARMGIQMLDGASGCTGTCELVRPVIINSRVLGGSGAYFTDGIHVTSDDDYPGVWGNNQGVINALVDGNNVEYVGETGYAIIGAEDSSLFNNRSRNMAASGSGFGIYMGSVTNTNMTSNVFTESLSATSTAIGIETFNLIKETSDSIFANNIIEGGTTGFDVGFEIGNSSNTDVHRNTFTNNVVRGASAGTTVAFEIDGDADDNSFVNNDIDGGGTNPWDTGFDLTAGQDRNKIEGNRYNNVTTIISDASTASQIGVNHHRATSTPTVNDDLGDGYEVGTVWINTSTNDSFLLTDSTTGSANWEQINGGGSGTPATDLAAVQARRTTTYTLTTTATDITLGTTDIENDATTVEHDNINTDRIYVYEDGIYLISYDATGGGTATSTHTTYARVRVNDTTILPGSFTENSNYQGEYSPNSTTFLADLDEDDYVSLQLYRDATTDATQNDITFSVTKLEGIQGASGGSGTGTDSETFTIDEDDTGGNLSLVFGTTLNESITWNSTLTRFEISDDLHATGSISTDSTATKYLWLDINGAVRTSAGTGSVNSGTSPVIRFDGTDNSRARWSFPVPDDWESGSDIEIEVFWSPEDGTAGNVYYELDYQSWASGETISGSTTLTSTEAAPGTTLELDSFTFTIPNTALSADDMVNIRVSREPGNVADTYASDVNIHLIRINYTGKKLL